MHAILLDCRTNADTFTLIFFPLTGPFSELEGGTPAYLDGEPFWFFKLVTLHNANKAFGALCAMDSIGAIFLNHWWLIAPISLIPNCCA